MIKILVIEDDVKLNQIICSYLSEHGYETISCFDAATALNKMDEAAVSLILSDIMMKNMDGFEFAEQVRINDKLIPILFMTARDDISSKQRGYKIGIDDYIVKPFNLEELVMKIGAILRRANILENKKLEINNFLMDEEEHTAYIDGKEIPLTVREFDILFKLLSYPKKTLTRSKLMEEFWDYDSSATSRTVDVYMAKIREKTAHCTGFEIVTVHGLGYKAVLK